MKRLFAIAVIWLGCTVAWLILGGAVHLRTDSLSGSLTDEVYALWGPPGRQAPPLGTYQKLEKTEETVLEQTTTGGSVKKTVQRETKVDVPVALDASNVHVKLALEQQRKGLMWFPTYGVDFSAQYMFLNDNAGAHDVTVRFPLRSPESGDGRGSGAPGNKGSFDGFAIVDSRGAPVEFQITGEDAVFSQHFEAGERRAYGISYRTRGTTSFRYLMAQGTGRVHDLTVSVHQLRRGQLPDRHAEPDEPRAPRTAFTASGTSQAWFRPALSASSFRSC